MDPGDLLTGRRTREDPMRPSQTVKPCQGLRGAGEVGTAEVGSAAV